jgi:hypothetical protein
MSDTTGYNLGNTNDTVEFHTNQINIHKQQHDEAPPCSLGNTGNQLHLKQQQKIHFTTAPSPPQENDDDKLEQKHGKNINNLRFATLSPPLQTHNPIQTLKIQSLTTK